MRRSIGAAMIAVVLSGSGVALADPPPPPPEPGSVQPIPQGTFAKWVAGVRGRIAQFSRAPKKMPKTVPATIVHFIVDQEGRVADAGISTSSGCEPCDDAALRAVALAQPFPPIPPETGRDHVEISVPIHFKGGPPRRLAHKGHA